VKFSWSFDSFVQTTPGYHDVCSALQLDPLHSDATKMKKQMQEKALACKNQVEHSGVFVSLNVKLSLFHCTCIYMHTYCTPTTHIHTCTPTTHIHTCTHTHTHTHNHVHTQQHTQTRSCTYYTHTHTHQHQPARHLLPLGHTPQAVKRNTTSTQTNP